MSEMLEEIKNRAIAEKAHYHDLSTGDRYWSKTYTISKDDYDWLIQQAERVEELEREYQVQRTELLEEHIERLQKENHRYKQALEDILSYNHHEKTVPEDVIEMIEKALKGESE